MTVLRTLKKLLLGETWLLPLGVAAAVGVSVVARHVLGDDWQDVGGFVLLAAIAIVLSLSVADSARRR